MTLFDAFYRLSTDLRTWGAREGQGTWGRDKMKNEERATDARLWHPWLRIKSRPARDAAHTLERGGVGAGPLGYGVGKPPPPAAPRWSGATPAKVRKSIIRKSPVRPFRCGIVGFHRLSAFR